MRIFISSTFEDLRDYRETTFAAIQTLGHSAEDMIFWSADERDTLETSLAKARSSDVMVLLVAHRYGKPPPGTSISITEAEYRAARAAKVPVLAFFLDENVPWPPAFIDHERRAELARFKTEVSREVVRKTFTSKDNLAAQVTQALALFHGRRPGVPPGLDPQFDLSAFTVSAPARLRTDPDLVVQIGQAEDGLPLLLQIRRSVRLQPYFKTLRWLTTKPGSPSPDALLDTFRQALEDFGTSAWAAAHVELVRMRDGSERHLYVTHSNLADLFVSLLTRLLVDRTADDSEAFGSVAAVLRRTEHDTVDTIAESPALQSSGGSNRFLGISPNDGALYSVGHEPFPGGVVEWRNFRSESIVSTFERASVTLPGHPHLNKDYPQLALQLAVRRAIRGPGPIKAKFAISRQEIGRSIVKICDAVADLHRSGRIHGDLKPQNVLFGDQGPELIDGFNVTPGSLAPGWTPRWSAPEQVLGRAVSETSDLYPIGLMISHLIRADLFGEVRKFRIPPRRDGRTEFDVFSSPHLAAKDDSEIPPGTFSAWSRVATRCLHFDPADRYYTATTLSAAISDLLENFPLQGERFIEPTGRLVAAKLIDGSTVAARLINDASPSNG